MVETFEEFKNNEINEKNMREYMIRREMYTGFDCIERFLSYLLRYKERSSKGLKVLGFNNNNFDDYFCLREASNMRLPCNATPAGKSILNLTIDGNIKF